MKLCLILNQGSYLDKAINTGTQPHSFLLSPIVFISEQEQTLLLNCYLLHLCQELFKFFAGILALDPGLNFLSFYLADKYIKNTLNLSLPNQELQGLFTAYRAESKFLSMMLNSLQNLWHQPCQLLTQITARISDS